MKPITSNALLKDLRELIAEARQDVARQVEYFSFVWSGDSLWN